MKDKVETVKVYVGADRSQALAVGVLEHSIKRRASVNVEVVPMIDLPVREPKDPRNLARTGFSFSRFCIPKLAGYTGRALYLDADMLVFRDIKALWEIPFDGAKVVIQREVKHGEETVKKEGAPTSRRKQCSVMLLDCERLDWDIDKIIDGLDAGHYDYEMLMNDLVILDESEIKFGVPFEWNSLEYFDESTCLIHYTDMQTQPWTSCKNINGFLWLNEARRMLKSGSLKMQDVEEEISRGYLRPSLERDIRYGQYVPTFLKCHFDKFNMRFDQARNYVPHKQVYANKKRRLEATKAQRQASESSFS
jgi:lipopolysaccharide biosynthesis glycosyltransferase